MNALTLTTPMTDGPSRTVHLITDDDDDAAAGRAAGRYVAVCEAIVVAAALATPDGQGCHWCTAWARHRGLR